MTRLRLVLALSLLAIACAAAWLLLGQYTRAAGLLVLASDIDAARPLARLHARPVVERDATIVTREGSLRARVYRPARGMRRTVVLVTGVHPAGIDEPRLMHFARSLAAVGLGVVTPELRRLFDFEITPGATDAIEDAARWAAEQDDLSADGRVGLAGISFSGGLAVVAAGRTALRDRVAFVLSIGGHGDLPRTLETLAGDALHEGSITTADSADLAIVLMAVAQHVVPADQVGPLREWGRTFLEAAHLPLDATARRRDLFARADRFAAALAEPAGALVRHVRAGEAAALRPHLVVVVRQLAADPALSPERAPAPAAPVYLLHGTDDEVIPPDESRLLAAHLRPHTDVELLITPVLAHADVMQELPPREAWAIIRFLASLLRR